MFGKDERGYVLSGMGLLLLIPVMIIIPIFIAINTQSSTLPNTMVASDTSYRTYTDIKTDIRNQIFIFGDNIQNKTFLNTESAKISGNITNLYNNVNAIKYQNVFKNSNLNITPNYTSQMSSWNQASGNASLKNGIIISYGNVSSLYTGNGGKMYCNYTMSIQSNMNIYVNQENGKNGHSQPYAEAYVYHFTVNSGATTNSTAISNLDVFFQGIADVIKDYV